MPASDQVRQPKAVTTGGHQFRIGGQPVTVYSGAVHYWRLDRDKWDDILSKVAGMGFTTITSYIPWEAHEIERGKFDFGEINPSNDIDAFITLCEEKNLKVIVRPGPQINSELTWFGYPRRILDDPEIQALSAMGSKAVLTQVPKPIPALSYAADKFFDETALWYDAIIPILAKHKHPKGNLVAVQVDNEMAFFFHINPYACDFSPASIRWYQTFLQEKYQSLEKVSTLYGKSYASFAEIDPPRRFEGDRKEQIPFYTDWIEYREFYLVNSLNRLADMMRVRGLEDIPIFHNYPHPLGPGGSVSGITTPFNLLALEEKLDFVGFDIYSRKELYDHIKTVVSYVVGTSRYPFIPEFIAGVWPWYLRPGSWEDEEFVTKAAMMQGIKGFSRYMIVERNRWLASPVRRDGRVRAENYEMYRRVINMGLLNRFTEKSRKADVLVIANRDYDRLEAASVLVTFPGDFLEPVLSFSEYPNFMTISEKSFGFKEPVQLAKADWFWKYYRSLTTTGYSFLISDSSLPLERLQQYKVLAISSFEFMGAAFMRNLVAYVKAGGTVVMGPRLPEMDEKMQPDDTITKELKNAGSQPVSSAGTQIGIAYTVGRGQFIHITDFSQPVAALEAVLVGRDLIRASKNDPRLDVAIHAAQGTPDELLVFVANPTAEFIQAQVGVNTNLKTVKDLWDERDVPTDGRSWSDSLPAYTIKIYECKL